MAFVLKSILPLAETADWSSNSARALASSSDGQLKVPSALNVLALISEVPTSSPVRRKRADGSFFSTGVNSASPLKVPCSMTHDCRAKSASNFSVAGSRSSSPVK